MVSVAGGPAVQVEPDVVTERQRADPEPAHPVRPAGRAATSSSPTPPPRSRRSSPTPGSARRCRTPTPSTVHAADLTGATGNADGPYADPPVTRHGVHRLGRRRGRPRPTPATPCPGQPLAWSVVVTNHGSRHRDRAVPGRRRPAARASRRRPPPVPAGPAAARSPRSCASAPTPVTRSAANASFPAITVTTGIPARHRRGRTVHQRRDRQRPHLRPRPDQQHRHRHRRRPPVGGPGDRQDRSAVRSWPARTRRTC